jgi:hypothetical protein
MDKFAFLQSLQSRFTKAGQAPPPPTATSSSGEFEVKRSAVPWVSPSLYSK